MENGIRARLEARRLAKRRKALRWFGVGLGLILGWLAWRARAHGRPWAPLEAALALAAMGAGLGNPEALEFIYVPWMKAAGLLGRINTALVMALLFYLIVTPYAWLARLAGENPQDDGEAGAASYWKTRSGPPSHDSYRAQF